MDHHPLAEAMGDLESNITPAPPGADDRYLQSILESLSQARLDLEESRMHANRLASMLQAKDEALGVKDNLINNLVMQLANASAAHRQPTAPVTSAPAVTPPAPILTPSNPGLKTTKLRDPDPFSGKREELYNFVASCRLKIAMEPHNFTNEFLKIGWASSHFIGTPKSWFSTLFTVNQDLPQEDWPSELQTFAGFVKKLNELYGDPNLVSSKARELVALRQTTSVTEYIAQFKTIAQFLQWNDDALKEIFKKGLKTLVGDAIALREEEPATLQEYMDVSNRIDIRLQQRRVEGYNTGPSLFTHSGTNAGNPRLHGTTSRPQEKPTSTTAPRSMGPQPTMQPRVTPASQPQAQVTPATPITRTPTSLPSMSKDGTLPMEIDATGKRVLSEAEKHRRRSLNLCLYCGSPDHHRATCPSALRAARVNALHGIPVYATELDSSSSSESTNDHAQE
jgi:hypothetical protein